MLIYRYSSKIEEKVAIRTGYIPNVNPVGVLKDVYFTPYIYRTRKIAEKSLRIGLLDPRGAATHPEVRMKARLSESDINYSGSVKGGDSLEVTTQSELKLIKSYNLAL